MIPDFLRRTFYSVVIECRECSNQALEYAYVNDEGKKI
jgi:hypothetical protein